MEGNGSEAWQKSLLYVFVSCFGGWPFTKPGKIKKMVMCAHTTNQLKHCDYVIHAWSMSKRQKMYRVRDLPT